jgi:hypothetical protein
MSSASAEEPHVATFAEQLAGRYRVDQGEPPLVSEMNVVLLQDDPCLVQDQIPFIARQARQLLAKVWQRNALHPLPPARSAVTGL